jgi:cytochrome c
MEDRFNTIAGWALFAGIVGLGLSSVSGHFFEADKPHRPHKMGYEIEGVEAEAGADSGPPLATLLATADIAKGEAAFAKCLSCHTIAAGGANGIGPNLHAVMGAAIGSHVPGFAYSDALKTHGGNWTWENMDAWLKSPKAFAAGTKMSFAGLGKAEERAALLLYLNAQGSNLPLPAAPAAEAAPAEGGEAAPAAAAAAATGAQAAPAAAGPAPEAAPAPAP